MRQNMVSQGKHVQECLTPFIIRATHKEIFHYLFMTLLTKQETSNLYRINAYFKRQLAKMFRFTFIRVIPSTRL